MNVDIGSLVEHKSCASRDPYHVKRHMLLDSSGLEHELRSLLMPSKRFITLVIKTFVNEVKS